MEFSRALGPWRDDRAAALADAEAARCASRDAAGILTVTWPAWIAERAPDGTIKGWP